MLDIRLIRENPEKVQKRLATRGQPYQTEIAAVLECDFRRRQAETRLQHLNGERKRLSKQIGILRGQGKGTEEMESQVKSFADEMESLNTQVAALDAHQKELLLQLPNLPAETVPLGNDSSSNPILRTWGKCTAEKKEDHVAIGTRLGLFDSDRATKISGSGFTCFTGLGARLERSLLNFLLDLHTLQHGYQEISPPFLIHRECMIGTGQLPKFEEDMYSVENGDLFLAPTAEVPVTNLHRDEILNQLPLRFVAYTPCFRREAGSAGRETRGLIRMHQFDKVELVKICSAESSDAELESLTADAEKVLQLLELPYRVIDLCSGDLGFSSSRTYDIEVWSPGQGAFLEVSSCSHFCDFQSRRMNLRYKDTNGKNRFAHTLNGSGTALARLYVALIETHLQSDGSVLLPEPLRDYFKADVIGSVS